MPAAGLPSSPYKGHPVGFSHKGHERVMRQAAPLVWVVALGGTTLLAVARHHREVQIECDVLPPEVVK